MTLLSPFKQTSNSALFFFFIKAKKPTGFAHQYELDIVFSNLDAGLYILVPISIISSKNHEAFAGSYKLEYGIESKI